MRFLFQKWLVSREGSMALDYGLLAGGIAMVIIFAVFTIGADIGSMFQEFKDSLDEVVISSSSSTS